jgi:hypothetical protein
MSRLPRKAPPPPPDTPSREPTAATPAPRSKKAKAVVSESPLTAEEPEEELEPQVRGSPRKVQNNRAANNATASKAKTIALKKGKSKGKFYLPLPIFLVSTFPSPFLSFVSSAPQSP